MKHKRIKTYINIGILLFGMACITISCEKEDPEVYQKELFNLKQRQVNFLSENDLPKSVFNHFKLQSAKLSNNSNSKSQTNSTIIDINNIMQVIDNFGNTNYTFRVNFEDNDPTTFYNLIINKNFESNTNISYILKYKIDEEHLQDWINNDYDFSYFSGYLYRYNINDFIDNLTFNRTTSKNSPVDTCPCNIEPIDGSSGTSGGSSSGSGSGSGGIGGTFTICRNEIFTFENPCNDINPDDQWTTAHGPTSTCSGSPGPTNIVVRVCETVSTSMSSVANKNTEDDCLNPCDNAPNDSNGDIGLLLPLPVDPCKTLNALLTHTTITNALSTLNAKRIQNNTSNNPNEYGFEVSNINSTINTNGVQGMHSEVKLRHGSNIIGGMHIHTDNGDPMFSAQDIRKLYFYYMTKDSPKTTDEVFSILHSDIGTFAITINNLQALGAFVNNFKKLERKLTNIYGNSTFTNDYTRRFLKGLKALQEDFDYPVGAINLHQLNSAGTAFEKVTLDPTNNDNDPIKTPCND